MTDTPTPAPAGTTDVPASAALLERARAVTPGGVNSPVRAFRSVGGTPRFMASGRGPYLTDVDGHEYVDLVGSWGPMILGHAHPDVLDAVQRTAARGTSFGSVRTHTTAATTASTSSPKPTPTRRRPAGVTRTSLPASRPRTRPGTDPG